MFDWSRFHDEVEASARTILTTGVVPGPPPGPYISGAAYPLAVDVNGPLGAVAYAALDPYPKIERGWWCIVFACALIGGIWETVSETDNSTSPRPFERTEVENCTVPGMDWLVHGYGEWRDETTGRYWLSGLSPPETARITVAGRDGPERDLPITPWCGGFAAIVPGRYARIASYDAGGRQLGSTVFEYTRREPA